MWFKTLYIALCVLVSSEEVNKLKYTFDTNFYKDYGYCDGDFPWILTEYEQLGVKPFNENNTRCIQVISKSCATSYPIHFSHGAIELNVYLELFSNDSGLTVTVFNENNVAIVNYELNRLRKNYIEGWNIILLDIKRDTVGYLNLKGGIVKEEIILVDSLQYSGYVKTRKRRFLSPKQLPLVITTLKSELKSNNLVPKSDICKKYWKTRFKRSINGYEDTSQPTPNDSVTTAKPTTSAVPNDSVITASPTTTTVTTDPEADGSGSSTTTIEDSEAGGSSTTTIVTTESEAVENSTTVEDSDSSTQQQNNFWSPLIITLVAVGSFVALSVTAVSAYYCGKFGAQGDGTTFLIDEEIPPQTIIPRVRNASRFEV
ncbi:uncharacterized protein LOC123874612 [Maniola jurtina]|uniref:uncharacterized protein LOC123874612 n=1 Tax=Maniola jurtina TaxID=191418 RepID=UPI001E689205|nr:uncharacterized protein LOC123874612 [Maniola jurtina]